MRSPWNASRNDRAYMRRHCQRVQPKGSDGVCTCSANKSSSFSLAAANADTSSDTILSKSSMNRGTGSGVGAFCSGEIEGDACEPLVAPEVIALIVAGCSESMEVAMSSSLEVAASSLSKKGVSCDCGSTTASCMLTMLWRDFGTICEMY